MNNAEAKEMFEEARRLVAENRHADALALFDQLIEAFPEKTAIQHARSKAFAAFERNDPVDDLGAVAFEGPEALPIGVPAEGAPSKFIRAIAIALVAVGAVGLAAYFMPGRGDLVEMVRGQLARAPVDAAPEARATAMPSAQEVAETAATLQMDQPPPSDSPQDNEEIETIPAAPAELTEPEAADLSSTDDADTPPIMQVEEPDVSEVAPLDNNPADTDLTERLIEMVKADNVRAAVDLLRDNRPLAAAHDYENRPVLSLARSVEMASLLVEAGADYDTATVGGWTPLMWIAGRNGNVEVAKYLIKLGAWVSIEDDDGMRPIHLAAFMGNHELVAALVEHGADINAIDDENTTPLHGAAWSGDLEGAKLYLAFGANPSAQNKLGKTPLDIATERGHTELLPILDPVQTAAVVSDSLIPVDVPLGTAGTRTLKFPNDVRLGTLQMRDWGSTDYKAWEPAGSAWGAVEIPVGKEVMLMVDVPRLDALSEIEPEGIQILYIREVTLEDAQLEHLYHLKGLRRISLTKVEVSTEAVVALQEALPECTIRE